MIAPRVRAWGPCTKMRAGDVRGGVFAGDRDGEMVGGVGGGAEHVNLRATPAVLVCGTILDMKRQHRRTLEIIYSHPVSANIQWRDIETLFKELGAEISEREGSRVAVVLFNEVRVFHRPHPSPNTDKGAVASIRKWFEQHGVTP